jgi:hypothetical protein
MTTNRESQPNESNGPERQAAERMRRRMAMANVVMRRVLNLPFRTPLSGQLMLLFYTGRRSGKAYRQPVSYIVDGDTLLTPGGGRWKENLREGEPITIRLRGRKVAATPEMVRDPDEVDRLLRVMVAKNRRLAGFVPFISADGEIDPEGLRKGLEYGFCLVRWHVQGGRS